jgi:hypothetical protein
MIEDEYTLNEKQFARAEKEALTNPITKILLNNYKLDEDDVSKGLHKAVLIYTKSLTEGIRTRTLNLKDPHTEAMIELLPRLDKIMLVLGTARKLSEGDDPKNNKSITAHDILREHQQIT